MSAGFGHEGLEPATSPQVWQGNKPEQTLLMIDSIDLTIVQIAAEVRTAKRELKKARTVLQMDKLKCRKRVLRRLGFASPSDVIEMKGRVACEISRWED